MVKVDAEINFGGIVAGTPRGERDNHILSFNVDRARGKPGTFSASIKVKADSINNAIVASNIIIEAGTVGSLKRIFTGMIKSANISPCREDPQFVILNISGEDYMSRLANKRFTRRCRSSKGTWVSIESVVRQGLRSGKFEYVPNKPWLGTTGADVSSVGAATKTRTIANPKDAIEKAPSEPPPAEEVSLLIEHVSQQTSGSQNEISQAPQQ